ncbi:uncharacterized protein LOC127720569 isoform X2 [Mytilus californianus]|uniref:uncharacterized protein LOC127720569 isoform X2 n=1 Tax=Mytilus californianus TaxID=6549 RepID=UPI00224741EC|nr:uncharacterized protein LOC127720569 isoform X2 [Mytilus californianus]
MSGYSWFSETNPLLSQEIRRRKFQSKQIVAAISCVILIVTFTVVAVYFGTRNDKTVDPTPRPRPRLPSYDLQKDHSDIISMFSGARKRHYKKIWTVLDKKPYLINVIPIHESFALLHYATLQNNSMAVHKLVNYTSCDVKVKSVPNAKNKHQGGQIPEQLALNKNIKKFLHNFTEKMMQKRFGSKPVFFTTKSKGEKFTKYGPPLLLLTLSTFKRTFLGEENISPTFTSLLNSTFQSTSYNLNNVSNIILVNLYDLDNGTADLLNVTSKTGFFANIVKLYTSRTLYVNVNRALKREALFDYKTYRPRSNALRFGPYALMLQAVLMYWTDLKPYDGMTYRGFKVNITHPYHVKTTFVYLNFMVTTNNETRAVEYAGVHGSIFVISNNRHCQLQPRDITRYSYYPNDRKYLYPSGAEFVVTANDGRHINLSCI